ncbi:Holliday junction resolvase RuvX [Candidatus Curtissbacteria bacterium]|nr:Holliday junction resolvase RuvX [Candidatus Curtissbacteria bacterium]
MILGIDLGQKKSGLAISAGQLASPYKTIIHKNLEQAVTTMIRIIVVEGVKTVVIGYVEGKTQKQFQKFADLLKSKRPDLEIIMRDETLTTRQARETMIKLGVPKKKKNKLEHEYSAAVILQSYLDEND